MVCCCFHTIVQERYSDESKSEVRGLKKEMFGYRSNVPKVRLTTDRLVVRPFTIVTPGVWPIITPKIKRS